LLVMPSAIAVGTVDVMTLFVEGAGLLLTLKLGEPGMVGYVIEVLVLLLKFHPATMLELGAKGCTQVESDAQPGGCMNGLFAGSGFSALTPRGRMLWTIRPSEST
jgi:hypothetical protein